MGGPEHMTGALGVNGHRIKQGVCHLACQEPAPDQLIELKLVCRQAAADGLRIQLHMGGADGFVGILGPGFCLIDMELSIVIVFAVAAAD